MSRKFKELSAELDASIASSLAKPVSAKVGKAITVGIHRQNLNREESFLSPFYFQKAKRLLGMSIGTIRELVNRLNLEHDSGKAHPHWNKHCLAKTLKTAKFRHEIASTQLHYPDVFRQWDHEYEGFLGRMEQGGVQNIFDELSNDALLALAIAQHHGKLSKRYFDSMIKGMGEIQRVIGERDPKWRLSVTPEHVFRMFNQVEEAWRSHLLKEDTCLDSILNGSYVKSYYKMNFFRSMLQICDKGASQQEQSTTPITRFDKGLWLGFRSYFDNPTPVQREAIAHVKKKKNSLFTVVVAPPGSGKTVAVSLMAKHYIVDKKMADRMVLLLPTMFTVNSAYDTFAIKQNLYAQCGLHHGNSQHAIKKGLQIESQQDEGRKVELNGLLKSFGRIGPEYGLPINVSTIDQAILSISNRKEVHRIRHHNLAHSCIVIDEFDAYNSYLRYNILLLMRVLHQYQVPIIIVSASMPSKLVEMFSSTPYGVPDIIRPSDDDDVVRVKLEKKDLVDINIDKPISEQPKTDKVFRSVFQRNKKGIFKHRRVIVYANTVPRAFDYYERLMKLSKTYGGKNRKGNIRVNLYHSLFTSEDRAKKEAELMERMGEKAANKKRGQDLEILVVTQIGEVSINITCDMMITDMAPLDRIYQRIGRLKRFFFEKKHEGRLVILNFKGGSGYFFPYSDQNGVDKQASGEMSLTCKIIHKNAGLAWTNRHIMDMIDEVYDQVSFDHDKAEKNSRNLLLDYLSFPCMTSWKNQTSSLDDEGVEDEEAYFFTTRGDIDSVDLFVERDSKYADEEGSMHFFDEEDFREFKNEKRIPILGRYLDLEKRNNLIKSGFVVPVRVTVGVEEEVIYLLSPKNRTAYNEHTGLCLPKRVKVRKGVHTK